VRALRTHAPAVRRAAGAVMIAAAALFTTNVPTELATAAPDYTTSLQRLEHSSSVARRIASLTGARRRYEAVTASSAALHDYGKAPDFAGITAWLNTPGGRPLSLAGLRGKVVLVDFWTYSCINCVRTLPYLRAWNARYASRGLVIVGVHTPEFAFEHVVSNVRNAVHDYGIRYPVAIDDDYETWSAWGNEYWPADYLIGRRGDVRLVHFGEGDYAGTERAIERLLDDGAPTVSGSVRAVKPSFDVETPETYLGFERGAYREQIHHGTMHRYVAPRQLQLNEVELQGAWDVKDQYVQAGRGASIRLNYTARRAYLVLGRSSPHGPSLVRVTVDGGHARSLRVTHDGLYEAASIPGTAQIRNLVVRVPRGIRAYSFTFG
jgi:thiol-disulfide isomerase/thioredoxin